VRRERYFHRKQALGRAKPLRKAKSLNEDALPTIITGIQSRDQHHHISLDTRSKIVLPVWLNQHEDDPALLVRPFLFLLILFSDG
jgi:hypothetical protein